MKKQLTKISTLAFALASFSALAQEKVQPCATYDAMEQAFKLDPQARKSYEAAEKQFAADMQKHRDNPSAKPAAFVYTVPVVFHVLYECTSPVISDAAIIQALKEVNDDYARKGPDTGLIAQPFKTSFIDSEIKFMLATRDPQGNCINGIVRHQDARTHWDQNSANLSTSYWAHTWDPTMYLNIYVVEEIINPSGIGITVGYTYKPGTWPSQHVRDAIVYNMNYLSGGGQTPKTRSLSHEIGHWLSLAHTWGNTNLPNVSCGDDGVSDTPVTKGEFGGCASSAVSACTQTLAAMNGLNNVQNIMNYSDCPRNFTTEQTTKMRNALASNISGRSNLYTPQNLTATGVNGNGLCTPIAEFLSTNCSYTVCAGSSLTFKDISANGVITSIAWSADNGGVVANPTASLTSIMFPNVGTSNVSINVTTGAGADTQIKTVTVVDNTPGFGPVQMESFEDPGIPVNWSVVDVNNDGLTWTQTAAASYDQAQSYMIAGAQNIPSHSDILQMPIMDVLNYQSNVLEFAYAYRQYDVTQNDVLKIEGSRDCGGTWSKIYEMSASLMQNGSGGIGSSDFVPAFSEWKTYVISSHPQWQNFKNSSSVMVRFNFVNGSSTANNIYIDAINWRSTTSVNELSKSVRFNVFPNPATGQTNVNFNLSDPSTIKVSVVDLTGREVIPATESNYGVGEQTIVVNKDNTLAKGVYFVNLSVNGAKMSGKLVIE